MADVSFARKLPCILISQFHILKYKSTKQKNKTKKKQKQKPKLRQCLLFTSVQEYIYMYIKLH